MNPDPYMAYYYRQQQQTGGAITQVFRGSPYQRGHGVGSFLGGMFRTIAPLFKSGMKAVGKEALKSGIGFLGDIAAGTMDPKVAARARVKDFTGSLKRKADDKLERVLRGGGGGGGGGGLCAKRRRVARKRNAQRATRKTTAQRVMRGGRMTRVTPQSLAKLLRGKTSPKRRSTAFRAGKTKRKKVGVVRKKKGSSTNVRDIFG